MDLPRPDLPQPLFQSRSRRGQEDTMIAIGPIERNGEIFCYRFDWNRSLHSECTYLYGGSDPWLMWRRYMEELAELEKSDGDLWLREMPRPSEVEKALDKDPQN